MFRLLALIFLGFVGTADAAPSRITCTYQAFGGNADTFVTQTLVKDGNVYRDVRDVVGGKATIEYQMFEDIIAIYLIGWAGGAITEFIIEKSDGQMVKVSAATFAEVADRRGQCHSG